MKKQVYISADYSTDSGDRNVVYELNKWGTDDVHKINFVDMSKVVSGSVSEQEDCRICDLKKEFNSQINASSAVIFVIGDKTAIREAGSKCSRNKYLYCYCTPYKHNTNGLKPCKCFLVSNASEDVGYINNYSYLRHEFEQAKKKNKKIIIFYNSLRKEQEWFPTYMRGYEETAQPFWIKNERGEKVGNYIYLKEVLDD